MLHVVHHSGYVASGAPGTAAHFDKYGLVMMALDEMAMAYEVHHPVPMGREWIEAVHDPHYVDMVMHCSVPKEMERRIGFRVTEKISVRARLSPGGTWLAAELALKFGFAANAAGGSHHAMYDTGAGYCIFNDLVVAANRLIADRTVDRILVIDLDVHQGDGTAALTASRKDIITFSVHAEKNFPPRKMQSDVDVALPDGTDDAAYLAALANHLPALLDRVQPGLILYQAGVDPHRDDRLGRLSLSDAGLAARDAYVMEGAAARGIPLASVLGGGYDNDPMIVARRHAASMVTLAATRNASARRA